MSWACSAYRREESLYRVWVGKPEGKKPLGRPRRRREDNIKMDFQEVGCGVMNWIELPQVVGTCECGDEPSGSIKYGEFLDQLRKIGKGMQLNKTVSIKVYLMAVLDSYMFRPLLAIFRLFSRQLNLRCYYIH